MEQPSPQSEIPKDEVQVLKEKLAMFMRRVEEERIQNQSLRHELRNAQKALAAEIGDETVVPKILSGETPWKGRAQLIVALKEKVRELNWKLSQSQQPSPTSPSLPPLSAGGSIVSVNPPSLMERSSMFSKSTRTLTESEKRRKQREDEIVEMEMMRREHEDMKRKYIAQKSRNSFLEKSVRDTKEKLMSLIEKTTVDDQLIAALKKELEKKERTIEDSVQDRWDEKDRRIEELQEIIRKLTNRPSSHQAVASINSRVRTADKQANGTSSSSAYQAIKIRNEGLETLNKSLESRVRQLEEEKNLLALEIRKEKRALHSRNESHDKNEESDVERLRVKVELQADEIQVLKANLQSLVKRREDEMRAYHDMLYKTKQLLVQ